ncbi:Vacuolar protein sorting-associated protein [Schistosoma japonicum]|uniref:SJCHGC07023 protein n=1 Tax=Schistosoma japonicum TaxID=6182 RepID=Q5DBT6_SCHJA|nr:SJCHGC07023 protein [Schistosoma japonicum]KAH8860616.1 Vacuolar protein sorting-associated protein 37B [Schistosoma japonicum]KAH8860617.1 Vacuolar protein sorting-associated protein 37B [Schistosoma japonicum]KAH8860618.1 Vacuolar protein sorting-associated protein 37B [Schistosoma japonicum]KAH8860619.1 Vacuolar protein sorting-associated protein 37B [Schistosoma japonicum]
MNYNSVINATNYNGVENKDEILSSLEKLSKTELEALLSDHEGVKKLAKNCSEIKKIESDLETCMHENRCQAETNLSMEPTFNMIKTELVEAYSNYKQLEGQYMKLKLEVDNIGTKYSPSVILALLQTANAQAEEQSEELANRFLDKSMDVDVFLKDFISLRKLCNERRFKCEKLAEQLSSGHINVSNLPNVSHSSYVPNMFMNTDASSANSSQLYPSLLSVSHNAGNPSPPTYGFKI